MSIAETVNTDFSISAQVIYVSERSEPHKNHFFFAYRMSIKNTGSQSAQLISRHWIITDALGLIEEVKGPGVIGETPKIKPGQSYEYESACPLTTPHGSMKGFYHFQAENGESFKVEIPEFYLVAPQALN